MTPTYRTLLFFAQLLVVACCHCGAVIRVSRTTTATRAYRFNRRNGRSTCRLSGRLCLRGLFRDIPESSSMGSSARPSTSVRQHCWSVATPLKDQVCRPQPCV
ncbi:hypothetical protein MRX96_005168 [Rhipicephalus microplus]